MAKIYLLNNQKFDGVENLEVFNISYIKSYVDLTIYDALIFTSKNAALSLNSFDSNWKALDSYVIAQKTANKVEELGGKVKFVAECKDGNEFALKLVDKIKNKKVLYIRAKKVVSGLVSILKSHNINIDELITYETICNNSLEKIDIENGSSIIFTSPSSVECFFKKYQWNKSFKAITIGKTTAKYLPDNIKSYLSPKTSIEECVKLAKNNSFNV